MSAPFYQDGLRFECTRCNNCCRYEPGYVFLSERDLQRLANGVGRSRDDLVKLYCRVVEVGSVRMLSLVEKPNYDCIFWEDGCTIYGHRPLQCRSYPFWDANVATKQSWQEVSVVCPGANRGKLHTKQEIDGWLEARHQDPPIVL